MFANTEGFFILLLYSVAVGVGIGILSALMAGAVDCIAPATLKTEKPIPLPHSRAEAERAMFPIDMKITARDAVFFTFDMVFCIISALSVIILLYHLNYGEVRAFSLVSALAGYIVCKKTLGKPISFLLLKLTILLKRLFKIAALLFRKLLRALLAPLRWTAAKTVAPVIEKAREKHIKKKARKYLLLLEAEKDNRTKKRKKSNEGNKSISTHRQG